MTRRTAVLTVGSVLLVLLGLIGTVVPVPYVAQVPGPTYNTLGEIDGEPVITIEGRERDEAAGNLNFTTVYVSRGGISLARALRGWIDDEVAVVPEETVYPPDRTREEVREANREAFLTSEQAAEAVALEHLGYPAKVVVQGLSPESPSEGLLEEGDAIESLDGRPAPDLDALDALLGGIPPGTEVEVGYTRLGEPGAATVTTAPAVDREGSLLGVTVRQVPSAPFDIDIQVEDVGGPSAGLMLTLGIIDLLEEGDLTGGAPVAGSGTIDVEGAVGPIGGIGLKMVAADEAGAELFLVPEANCAEAVLAERPGLLTARVATLEDALAALEDLRAGRTPTPC